MKGLILSCLAGLVIASIGSGYADAVRMTVVNESVHNVQVTIASARAKIVSVSGAGSKMFTADYTYPGNVLVQGNGQYPKTCAWSVPPIGKQASAIRELMVNVSNDPATKNLNCLLSSK